MDILDTIVAAKRKQVEKFKPMSSIERFERDGFFWPIANRSLVQVLQVSWLPKNYRLKDIR